MDDSIAHKAIEEFLETNVTHATMDTIHGLKMQAEIAMRYLELPDTIERGKANLADVRSRTINS